MSKPEVPKIRKSVTKVAKTTKKAIVKADTKKKLAKAAVAPAAGLTKPEIKNSPGKIHGKYLKMVKKMDSKTRESYRNTMAGMAASKIKGNSRILNTIKPGTKETGKQRVLSLREEQARRIAAYTSKCGPKSYILNYPPNQEYDIGCGEIFLCANLIKIEKSDGTIIIAKRMVTPSGKHKGRLAFCEVNPPHDYAASLSGAKVTILDNQERVNVDNPKAVAAHTKILNQEEATRKKHIAEYKQKETYTYTSKPKTYKKSLDISSEKFSGKEENEFFTRELALVETKDGKKYHHIVTRAKINPRNRIRKMKGRWDERLVLEWAKDLEIRFGVPRILILGTSILESGRGHNRLSYELGNYFGIKPWGSLKRRMNKLARSKYPEYKELGDFKNNGKQDHMHYSDAWSSYVRYSQLISRAGRYKHATKYTNNPMMALACIALSGYCPSKTYIRSVGRVLRGISRKYNLTLGVIDYNELIAHMKNHNASKLSVKQMTDRLRPAAKEGFVKGFPGIQEKTPQKKQIPRRETLSPTKLGDTLSKKFSARPFKSNGVIKWTSGQEKLVLGSSSVSGVLHYHLSKNIARVGIGAYHAGNFLRYFKRHIWPNIKHFTPPKTVVLAGFALNGIYTSGNADKVINKSIERHKRIIRFLKKWGVKTVLIATNQPYGGQNSKKRQRLNEFNKRIREQGLTNDSVDLAKKVAPNGHCLPGTLADRVHLSKKAGRMAARMYEQA